MSKRELLTIEHNRIVLTAGRCSTQSGVLHRGVYQSNILKHIACKIPIEEYSAILHSI
uniref:Uncharacterized protein n=1 Tax=Arundo donax TaxID=35708 RepID=A0A0A8YA45_ARUDO